MTRLPSPEDVVLCVEIAVTRLREARAKAAVYAAGGVPHYWIVDVANRRLDAYASPSGPGYASVHSLADTETLLFPETDAPLNVRDLLP
ncbi:MAG: Uma2 family endonuclease [Myxococcota bacterium]